MKLIKKLTIFIVLIAFMFAGGINFTFGNAYTNAAAGLQASHSFGLWIDVNESASVGWEGNGLKIGFAGPADTQVRLGFDPTATTDGDVLTIANSVIGMSRTWWTSDGANVGWATNMSTALDWNMTGSNDQVGDFTLTMNLGFGF